MVDTKKIRAMSKDFIKKKGMPRGVLLIDDQDLYEDRNLKLHEFINAESCGHYGGHIK